MQLVRLHTIDELLSAAANYNDLWRRSEVALPTARAESLAIWLEKFAPRQSFELLVVVDAGRFAAALPLVGRRLKGLLPAACLPVSPWWASGELLVDASADRPAAESAAALDALIAGFARLRRPLVWLDAVRFATPRWQAFIAAAQRAGLPASVRPQAVVGQVEIDHDWDDYQARWSKGHRHNMKRSLRLAEAAGGVQLRIERAPAECDLPGLVRQGFEVEHRSWKGAAGSSVLSQPGMLEFYVEQARRLAAAGCLELVFLDRGGEPIAFEYGLTAKGTYFSYKVGYDERFAGLTPGQLLRLKLLERFHAEPGRTLLDFAGPLCRATAKWSTRVEPVGRLVIGAPTLAGRWASAAYGAWRQCRQAVFPERPAAAVSPGVRPRSPDFADYSS
ncbi:MAG TPA: GNAT family N-acetyltransferase [Pirellulales bacterium]|nr:GNAT family N-acetyltransferase [Pirellulales bacterium]